MIMADSNRVKFIRDVAKENLTDKQRAKLISALQEYKNEKSIDTLIEHLRSQNLEANPPLLKDIRKVIVNKDQYIFDQVFKHARVKSCPSPSYSSCSTVPSIGTPESHARSFTTPVILPRRNVQNGISPTRSRQFRDLRNATQTLPNKTHLSPERPLKNTPDLPKRNSILDSDSQLKNINFPSNVSGNVGFDICGGIDNSSLVFVSDVCDGSLADRIGVIPNDAIVEVNGVLMESIELLSAARVIKSVSPLKLVLKRGMREINVKSLPYINPWEDREVQQPLLKERNPQKTPGADKLRLVKLIRENGQSFGFNIRGGSEYGIGIFISNVVEGSIAAENDLRIGDQIIEVNGRSFELMTHTEGAEYMKNQSMLGMKVMANDRLAEGKHYVEEYTWVSLNGERATSRPGTPESVMNSMKDCKIYQSVSDVTPEHSKSNSPIPQISNRRNVDNATLAKHRNMNKSPNSSDRGPVIKGLLGNDKLADDNLVNEFSQRSNSANNISYKSGISDKSKISDGNGTDDFKGTVFLTYEVSLEDEVDQKPRPKRAASLSNLAPGDELTLQTLKHRRAGSLNDIDGKKSLKRKLRNMFSLRKKKEKENARQIFNASLLESNEQIVKLDEQLQTALNVVEYKKVKMCLEQYFDKGNIDKFTSNLLEAINTPGKHALIAAIRNIVFPYDVAQFDSITEPFREKNNNIPEPESAEMGTKKMFHTLGKIYKRNHYSVARRDGTTINGLFDDGRKYPENILNGDLKTKYENSVIDKQIHPDIEKESPTDNKQKDKKDKKGKSKSKRKKDKDQVKTLPINNSKNKDRNSTFRDILPKRNYVSKSVSIRNRSKSLDLLNIYKDKDIKSPHEVSLKLERPGDVIYPTNAGKERVERSHSLDFLDHIPDSFLDNYPERDYPNEDEHDSEKKNQYEYDEADFVFGDDSGRNSPKDSSSLNRPPSVRGDFYDHVAGTVFSDNSNLLTVEHQISRSEHESPYAAVMKGGIKPSLIVSDVDNKSPVYDVEISKSPTAGVFSYQLANDNEEIIEGQSPRSPAHKYLFEHQVTIDETIYSAVNDLRITTASREPEKYHAFKLMKHYKSLGLSICGGSDSKSQHDIKIGIIHPDSAASQTNLKVGQILVSVDGESLLDVTHKEAVNLIRALYRDKTKPHMELVVADAV